MNKHTWKTSAGSITWTANSSGLWRDDKLVGPMHDAAAGEILRLAQRVQDLEHVIRERGQGTPAPEEIDREAFEALDPEARFLAYREAAGWACHARGWEAMAKRKDEELRSTRANFDEISRRLAEKESDRLRLEMLAEERLAACDQLRAQVTEREHQLVLAKETAASLRELDVNRQRVILGLREQLAASESRGRQYCLELAEKAEEIRSLNGAFALADQENDRHIARIKELEEQLAGEIMENHALKMTIEEGSEIEAELAGALAAGHGEDLKPCIAPCPGHLGLKASAAVDRAAGARRALETSLDELKAILREHGLLPAKYEDEEALAPPCDGFTAAQLRVIARIDKALRQLSDEIQPPRQPPARVRLESLEEASGNHAVMLTDHADRLKALEHHRDDVEAVIARPPARRQRPQPAVLAANEKTVQEAHNRLVGRVEALEESRFEGGQ